MFYLLNLFRLEIHADMKEIIENSSIPDCERPFTGILFVDNKGGSLNFGWPKHKTVRQKFMYGDLVIFSGDVFHGGTCNNSTKNNIRILYQFHSKNFKFAPDSVGFAKVYYKSSK